MNILAIETSAVTCSAACCHNGDITVRFVNNGLNHSRTLMPLVDEVLQKAGVSSDDIDTFACSIGPGSFTGVRIGVSAIKGMASACGTDCIGVSTLEVIAHSAPIGYDGVICCVMDARREQFYTAFFHNDHGRIVRLSEDAALAGKDIALQAASYDNVLLMGDGARVFEQYIHKSGARYTIPEGDAIFQRADGVIAAVVSGNISSVSADKLTVSYLRLSQAEREFNEKTAREKLK